jgi:hypothetical protein
MFQPFNERRMAMAQKGAGGNAGAVTGKGGDGAHGSSGTGRGGGKTGSGSTGSRDKDKAENDEQKAGGDAMDPA